MVPVAGSAAYTYAYATLGELLAWIIGWDLVLEYALSSATVATGWSGYFQSMLGAFGLLPHAVANMRRVGGRRREHNTGARTESQWRRSRE